MSLGDRILHNQEHLIQYQLFINSPIHMQFLPNRAIKEKAQRTPRHDPADIRDHVTEGCSCLKTQVRRSSFRYFSRFVGVLFTVHKFVARFIAALF
ncbi:hypothetical protein M430DRAFT_262018 [Amorphotheca resinae ATCC 22711]|jgi:hypothetical protein|uniref:Uncharacterized protein n=1 Tax=Amorphotheca resinae ATCC 22711 TaxID=857342 RepID=A0A2T3AW38_AMORE|nr:hypothetical protein M430DRAFT_262018 [Amorphotheca resinae ATCC 22711]PSS12869.1 hypothetical protein M430DRAFT_262018 [Amorphotheca resinae ATCC 22711]